MGEIKLRAEKGERVLVTTLTTKMAEDLTDFLNANNLKAKYIHHNVDTIERMEIIRSLRLGEFDALVGINLLREGLDIPEVSLVAILDADKEGLFHSETSLIQTIGRAARNAEGKVIMYADSITRSMERAINETDRRRAIQIKYNEENGIVPKTSKKGVHDIIDLGKKTEKTKTKMSASDKEKLIAELTKEMRAASAKLEFEKAAYLRDQIKELRITKK